MADVAVVVVTHQTRADALACLGTVQVAQPAEVVLVDCGSTDGTADAVRACLPWVEVLALDNLGYAGGANAGIARTSSPLVLLLNADTRIAPDSLVTLAASIPDDVGALGPRVVYPDGRHQASARMLPTTAQGIGHALFGLWWPANPWTRAYRQSDRDPDQPRDVDWVSGCAILLRRAALDEVGGFDTGYWMYVEDIDLCFRLRQAGWRVRYDPSTTVVHAVGRSTSQRRGRLVVAHARSLDRFHRRAYGHGAGRLTRPLVRLGLLAWVGTVLAWDRLVGRRAGRSSTGE